MSDWQVLSLQPTAADTDGWFAAIADRLLNGARIVVGGESHCIVEIEFYFFAADHADPYPHRHPLQAHPGRWYFHRTGNAYRNGSFKGLDLTFSDGVGLGGVLIRGIEKPDGSLVDGPSLCVDYFLAGCKCRTVAELDQAIGGRASWQDGNPLLLETVGTAVSRPIVRTARIGLTLKKLAQFPASPRYLMRPYRFMTEPRRVRKGKPHLVLALHVQGVAPEQIGQITGCPRSSIQRYIEDFDVGRADSNFEAYRGLELGPREVCRLHGLWHSRFGE